MPKHATSSQDIEQRLKGSFRSRFWRELFRNSGQFPIGIILLEALKDGAAYFGKPDLYVLIPSALVQAYWMARQAERPGWQRFFGNFIAPALYSLGEMMIEGLVFFESPHHIAYWGFVFVIGALQAFQSQEQRFVSDVLLVLENMIRANILFAIYAIFESYTNASQTVTLATFFLDPSHVLIGSITLLLGISVGLADVSARHSLDILQKTADQLKVYSEWLLGRNLLGRALDDPDSMSLTRQQRTVLFMDIRDFTHWSEQHSPEDVASLLSDYYLMAESILGAHQVIKYKFTADEVMCIFIESSEAVQAAIKMRDSVQPILFPAGLTVGIGIHTGVLVEGLLGGHNVRFYDVLGDTVNTAERIESAAEANEIWISEATRSQLPDIQIGEKQKISVKGKEFPIEVYLVQ